MYNLTIDLTILRLDICLYTMYDICLKTHGLYKFQCYF